MVKIISAFATMGKTTLAKKDKRIVDLDSSAFSWVEKEEFLEDGTAVRYKERNPNFAEDYFSKIKELVESDEVDLVLISTHKEIRKKLTEEGMAFYTVIPTKESKEEVLRRMKERGDDEKFIEMIDETFDSAMKSALETTPVSKRWGTPQRLVEFDLGLWPTMGLASNYTELAKETLSPEAFLVYEFSLEYDYIQAKTPAEKTLFLLQRMDYLNETPDELGQYFLGSPIEDDITETGRWSIYGKRVYEHHSDPDRFLAEYYEDPATEMQEPGPSSFVEVRKKIEVREIVTYV